MLANVVKLTKYSYSHSSSRVGIKVISLKRICCCYHVSNVYIHLQYHCSCYSHDESEVRILNCLDV